MRYLELEALDGSKWAIPVSRVIESYRRDCDLMTPPTDAQLADWAQNNMNWTDVNDQAVMVKQPDPLDMADSWANGKLRVVEGHMPSVHDVMPRTVAPEVLLPSEPALSAAVRAVSEPGDFPAPESDALYCCKREDCRRVSSGKLSCDRGPCPMEPVSVTVKAPENTVIAVRKAVDAPRNFAADVTDSLAKYLSYVDLPNLNFVLNSRMGDVTRIPLRISIDPQGVSLDVTEGFTDADAISLFILHALKTATRQRAVKFSGPELLALYNSMKSEDVLANVEPGDHGNAILEAYGRRVIAAVMEKVRL